MKGSLRSARRPLHTVRNFIHEQLVHPEKKCDSHKCEPRLRRSCASDNMCISVISLKGDNCTYCVVQYTHFFALKSFLPSMSGPGSNQHYLHSLSFEGGPDVSESHLLSIMSRHKKSKVDLGQVVSHYHSSKVSNS